MLNHVNDFIQVTHDSNQFLKKLTLAFLSSIQIHEELFDSYVLMKNNSIHDSSQVDTKENILF